MDNSRGLCKKPVTEFTLDDTDSLLKCMKLPTCLKSKLFAILGGEERGYFELEHFVQWREKLHDRGDPAEKFVNILKKPGNRNVDKDDIRQLLQCLTSTHPAFESVREGEQLPKYIETVVAKIFFGYWTGQITTAQLRKDAIVEQFVNVENQQDLGCVEHGVFRFDEFMVISDEFNSLCDDDDEEYLDRHDFQPHLTIFVSDKILERIFQRHKQGADRLEYSDFVTFVLANCNQYNPKSIEYFFRALDLDDDGILSVQDIATLYKGMSWMAVIWGESVMDFKNFICMMFDAIKPRNKNYFTVSDLKRSKLSPLFINTLINVKTCVGFKKDSIGLTVAASRGHLPHGNHNFLKDALLELP